MQVRQRRVAGAEIVQVQADGHGVQPLDRGRPGGEVVHQGALGDLQGQTRGIQAGHLERALDLGGDAALGELASGDVDADSQRRPARVLALPRADLPAGLGEHPAADRPDQAGLLRNGDEEIGREQPAARMLPARERLEPDHGAGLQIDDRLVVRDDLVAFQRVAQLGLDPQRGDGPLVHVTGEDLVAGAAACLGPIHRGVRVA